MKFKLGAALIILSTVVIIGVIGFVVNQTPTESPPHAARKTVEEEDVKDNVGTFLDNSKPKKMAAALKSTDDKKNESPQVDVKEYDDDDSDDEYDNEDDEDEGDDEYELSQDDIEKINSIANLTEAELSKELDALKSRIEEEDLFNRLENNELIGEKQAEAKAILERFALLGLEGTRRKYMGIEPELKDALYAHKESLKEIRELLNDN